MEKYYKDRGVTDMKDKQYLYSGSRLGFFEKSSYVFYGFSLSMVDGLIASFLIFYYTDIFILPAAALATMLLIARIWDGVNDPIMGYIMDSTKGRYGKFKPYILGGTIGMFVFGILTFYAPSLSVGMKIAWAYVTYICVGMTQTVTQIPYYAMPCVMTSDSQERTKLISIAKIVTTVSSLAAGMMIQPLMKAFGKGNDAMGILITVVLIMTTQMVAGVLLTSGVKERIPASRDKVSLKTVLPDLWMNKPALIMVILGFLRKPIFTITLATLIYFVTYNLGSQDLMVVFMGVYGVAAVLGMLVLPLFTKKIGQKKTYMIYSLGPAITGIIFFIIGWDNVIVSLIFASLGAFFGVAPDIITRSLLFDAIDYGELKTGRRSEGVTYSVVTSANKIAGGIGSALVVLLMAATGYVGGAAVQTPEALRGIFFVHILIPALISLVTLGVMQFYRISDKDHIEIVHELDKKRAASEMEL
jgi:sugar (glycoside-pentoside-hexuronide) transporter